MRSEQGGALAVVVVNWNRCELLRRCLQSLARQTIAGRFDVVVVDNGSHDGSVEMLQREFSNEQSFRLQVIRNQENKGFCEANNQGITAIESEFVALLNNDAEAEPRWLETLAQAFQDRPEVGMAASKILVYEDPSRIDKVGHLIYPDGQNRGRGSGEIDVGQYDRIEEVLWPDGCAAMYRRQMLDGIGLFDEDFFAYADDAELGLRARVAGWSCLYMPGAVVRHHRGQTLGLLSTRRLELIERNRILLAAKLFPWSLLWLNGVYYGIRIAAGMVAALRGKGEVSRYPGLRGKARVGMALIKGDLAALWMLPRMFRKRRQLKHIRKLTSSQLRRLLLDSRISLRTITEQAI